jgi:hypothetical protein
LDKLSIRIQYSILLHPFINFFNFLFYRFSVLSVNVSIFTLTAIAVDRHKAIINPLRARLTKNAYKIVIVTIWTVSLTLALPMIYGLRVIEVVEMRLISKLIFFMFI